MEYELNRCWLTHKLLVGLRSVKLLNHMSYIGNRVGSNVGYFLFCKQFILKNIQCDIASFLFTYYIINIIEYPIMSCIIIF